MLAKFRRHTLEPAARQSTVEAQHEANRAGQAKISSEHLLLGLLVVPGPAADAVAAAGIEVADLRERISSGNGAASAELDGDALSSVGIDLDAIRRATDAAFGPGALDRARSPRSRHVRFSDDAKQAVVGAVRVADTLGQHAISPGHLLIGILDHQSSSAVRALADAGVDPAALRADVLRRMSPAA
jgi:ATP-dependent Clp protease ATP-binding subunit ClpA